MNDNLLDKLRKKYRLKALIIFLVALVSVVIYTVLLMADLRTSVKENQDQNNIRFFSSTFANLNRNVREIENLRASYNENNEIMLDDLVTAYSNNNYRELRALPVDEQVKLLADATSTMRDCIWLLITNGKGEVIVSDTEDSIGIDLIEMTDLTAEDLTALYSRTIENLVIDNPYYGMGEEDDHGKNLYLYCRLIPGAKDKDGSKYILLAFSSEIIDTSEDALKDISSWINGSIIGNNSGAFVVDATTDTVIYNSVWGEEKNGAKASEAGFTPEVLTDVYKGTATLFGTVCYVSSRSYSSDLYGKDIYIVSALPLGNMFAMNLALIIWSVSLYVIFIRIIIVYCSYTRSEILKKREDMKETRIIKLGKWQIYFSHTLAGKIIPVTFVAFLMMITAGFYQQTLLKFSDCFADTVATEEEIMSNVEKNAYMQEAFSDYHDMQYLTRANLMSFIVSLNANEYFDFNENYGGVSQYGTYDGKVGRDVIKDEYNNVIYVMNNSKALQELKDENKVANIYLISDMGVTLATSSGYWNFALSTDPEDQSYQFWDILNGRTDEVVQDAMISDKGDYSRFIGCPLYYYTCLDENRNTKYVTYVDYMHQTDESYKGNEITRHRGLLQIQIDATGNEDEAMIDSAKPEYVLSNTRVSNDGFLMAFRYEEAVDDYKVFYSQMEKLKDEYATDLGISKKAFTGEYNGFQTYDGELYLQCFRQAGEYYIATAMPVDSLYFSSIKSARSCAILSFVVMFFIAFLMILISNEGEERLYQEESDPYNMFIFRKKSEKWKRSSPSQKFEIFVKNSFIILALIFLVTVIMESGESGNNSAIFYILSGEWDRGVHIFSLSACFVIVIAVIMILKLFSNVVYIIAEAFGNRVLTMMRLFVSLVKTVVIAAAVLYCLYLVGIDGTRLLASAGIMSVVVGLGAQSLVGDLLAGIFIILEGSLHVGDYVLINGVRGKITEIGLRITRYEDDNQNIRVICNNELKSFANMSEKYSVVYYNIPVPYNEDYQRIRKVLNKEFLKMYEEHHFLKSIPACQGIEAFSESSVDMRVRFMCEESERFTVQRYMHDQIMRIFMENDITIPFNQLDVHFEREIVEKAKELPAE